MTLQQPAPDDASETIRVVIVDDHEMVARAIESFLNAQDGIEVVGTAADVDAGRAVVDREQPDVVLMDFKLPSGDGVTLAAALKDKHADLRVLILTGQHSDDVVTRAITEGCDGFLSKSAGVEEMIDAIRRAHGGEAVFTRNDLTRATRRMQSGGPPTVLSERELEVLRCMADGASTAAIAESLYISLHTVRSHVRHILEKLGAHSKLEAVSMALRDGIVTVDR